MLCARSIVSRNRPCMHKHKHNEAEHGRCYSSANVRTAEVINPTRVSYGVVWYGMVWYGMVWYGMVWYGMVWYGMVWYGVVWDGMVWYGMVWCGMGTLWCAGTGSLRYLGCLEVVGEIGYNASDE